MGKASELCQRLWADRINDLRDVLANGSQRLHGAAFEFGKHESGADRKTDYKHANLYCKPGAAFASRRLYG
ncbi:hypothetical protein D3C81_1296730 [compost metagenome]